MEQGDLIEPTFLFVRNYESRLKQKGKGCRVMKDTEVKKSRKELEQWRRK
jgi:hypothetical protein